MELIKNLPTRISKSGRLESWAIFWCDGCKQEVERRLAQGKLQKSCGCLKIKHGGKGTRLYKIWDSMKQRILNPNKISYKDYGGRYITICNEWLKYIPFRDWALNNGYNDTLEIDRKKNDGNYEPDNCQWITHKENCRKRRGQKIKNMKKANEIRYMYNTGDYTYKELSEKYNVSQTTIAKIINNKSWVK